MDNFKLINKLPNLIEEYRKNVDQSVRQSDIADAIGLPEATLSRYINGHISSAKFDIEARLCLFFSEKLKRPINRGDLFSFDIETSN